MGSGYGGKHTGDAAVEAARLAKAAGQPVRLVWTREEEFTWAYFRPAGLMELKGSRPARRHARRVGASQLQLRQRRAATPYNVANPVTEYHASKSPLRQGSYRALASTANHFARESFMDELAHAVGMDPLAFRRKNLTEPRLLAVLNAAADKFGWATAKSTPTRGFGIACGMEKGGHVATCAEVAIDAASKKVRIVRVVSAWESGAVVNPDGLRNQNMGAIVQGIGGALFEAIRFSDGRILNPHFESYRVPALQRHPAGRDRPPRPQGPAFRRRRRDRPRRPRSRRRQRHLRRHRRAPAPHAHGPLHARPRPRPVPPHHLSVSPVTTCRAASPRAFQPRAKIEHE